MALRSLVPINSTHQLPGNGCCRGVLRIQPSADWPVMSAGQSPQVVDGAARIEIAKRNFDPEGRPGSLPSRQLKMTYHMRVWR